MILCVLGEIVSYYCRITLTKPCKQIGLCCTLNRVTGCFKLILHILPGSEFNVNKEMESKATKHLVTQFLQHKFSLYAIRSNK